MKIKVIRHTFEEHYTEGYLYINNQYFCDTLEDKYRDLDKYAKVNGETAIPEGTYPVTFNMSPKFKRKMPRLVGVPHFTGILIHAGNTDKDSAGCILVGKKSGDGILSNSRWTSDEINRQCQHAEDTNDNITIEVINKKEEDI